MFGHRLGLWITLTLAAFAQTICAEPPTIEDLKKQADKVLAMDNIQGRAHIDVVMQLADRLAADKQYEQAVKYYEAGLKHHPLDLDRQLACAKLLVLLDKKDQAQDKAKIVAKVAEEDRLRVPALTMLGEKPDTEVQAVGKLDGNVPTIVLVPMDEIDVLLIREVRQKLQEQLGITILIRKVPMTVPPFKRDPFHELCGKLHEALVGIKQRDPRGFEDLLKEAGFQEGDLAQDEKIIEFYRWLVDRGGDKKAKDNFEPAVAAARREDKQWSAEELLTVLKKAVEPYEGGKVRFLGATRHDIFGKNSSFLFALTTMDRSGVMSYRRFMSANTGETVNRDRLLKRMVNQALSSSGKVFGIDNCSDPTCPRAYPNSVAEHDAKSDRLCEKCQKAFKEAFGQK